MNKQNNWNFNNTYQELPQFFYSSQNPSKVPSPNIALFNIELAKELGLQDIFPDPNIFSGNKIPEKTSPIAQAYAGHQFGHFTILGDGRAILLGEHITPLNNRVDIQLKGSGQTPYSRRGDGKATLGPMLREYIISEALCALGIPTTRSLAVTLTGENILREKMLPGAVLTRVASSHLRVGTFQFAAIANNLPALKNLADYAIKRHYPELKKQNSNNIYLEFFQNVIRKQALLIAHWQSVGFIHGVMNTDNMSISGESIDFGPCAFMNSYDPRTVFSSIDTQGRYSFGNQPSMALWNLARLADSLLPLFNTNQTQAIDLAQKELCLFEDEFKQQWILLMSKKLGFIGPNKNNFTLIKQLLNIMLKNKADYVMTFIGILNDEILDESIKKDPDFKDWKLRWEERISSYSFSQVTDLMNKNNPLHIPRNHNVEIVLKAAVEKNDFEPVKKLLKGLNTPFNDTLEMKSFNQRPPDSDQYYKTYCGT